MSRYTLRGRPDIAGKYVVAAVTGYFYSIACASTTKGVDDSLQVNLLFSDFYYAKLMLKYVELVDVAYILLFS
jgi:hypothetical protein